MIAEIIINSNVKDLNKTFDYNIPKELENKAKIGSRVFVPFGNSKKAEEGFIFNVKENTPYKVKDILKILDSAALTKEDIELALYMARRYFCNVSDCAKLMIPPGKWGKNVREKNPFENKNIKRDKKLKLNNEQQYAYDEVKREIDNNKYAKFLMFGITGSRKNRSISAANRSSY